MPFDQNAPKLAPQTVGVAEFDTPDPSFLDTVSAAFRQENTIGSYLASARRTVDDFNAVDMQYNVFDDVRRDGMEKYADRFEKVYNPDAYRAVKSDIEKETRDRQTLAASGWTGAALTATASIADPTLLIPGGALVRAGRAGFSVGRSALAVGTAAAAGTAIQEAGLQATQETRTPTESAFAIGGSAILGSLLGAAGAKFFSKGEWERFGSTLKTELEDHVPDPDAIVETIVSRAQSAGAASVDDLKLDDLGVGGPKIAQAVAKATAAARVNPGIQTMLSPSKAVRETYTKMVDNPIYSKMNMEGATLGSDVENLVKQYDRGALGQWIGSARSLYREAKDTGYRGTKQEFYEAVAKAGRRGDFDAGSEQVTKLAQLAREKIFNPLLNRAQELKLLPDDVKPETAPTYVTRLWNREKLIGEEPQFREIARNYFRQEIGRIPLDKRPDFVSKADMDDYVEEVVTSVFNNLTGKNAGDVPSWLVPVKRGPLKERTFKIGDELIEEYLDNDMEMILRRYSRTMAAEVELTGKFGRADMKDQLEAVSHEYEALRKGVTEPKELEKLHASEARDLTNLEAFRDMIRGTYRAAEEGESWSKLTRAALAWNYMRLLGGVTMSSLTDSARLIGVHGVRATMREALPALVSNLKAAKISKADARDLGAVTETVLQSRLASLAELNNPYGRGSKFDRFLSNTTNVFTKATGLSWWNDTMKTMASVMTQNRILRNAAVRDYSKIPAHEKAYMAYLGIDETMAQRIADQFDKFGVKEQGIHGANVEKWTDDLALRAYAAALNKDVDRTIVTKGVADTPLWMKTNWGKLIMQFKSFGLASHQRVLIAGLQERPHRLAEQMVLSSSIGMMVAYLKFMERGDFDEAQKLVDNPGKWIADGLDRTGILFLLTEPWNTADKVISSYGGPNMGMSRLFSEIAGDEDSSGGPSRFASRNATGAVGGPSVGMFEDLANIAAALGKGDFNRGSVNAAIRQIPGATLPGIRSAIHVGLKPALHEAAD